MAFKQSPTLKNKPKALTNYLICTVKPLLVWPRAHFLRWLKFTHIQHGGKQHESKATNGEDYFVFKRQGWWNDVSGVRMTWASIGISSSESSQSLDTRHHHYHRRRRRHHCHRHHYRRRRHVPLAAQNNDFISLVFNKTHRWTCIQIRSSGRTRTFASSDESPIFCFPL